MPEAEQWPVGDTDTWVGECASCGQVRPVRAMADPFVSEGIDAGDPDETSAWCRPCYEARLDEI